LLLATTAAAGTASSGRHTATTKDTTSSPIKGAASDYIFFLTASNMVYKTAKD
jgi:hypothetical protein